MQDPRSVEKLRRGDVATLKRIFKTNHSKLFPLVLRFTHDPAVADDIILETFQKLWQERRELDRFEVLDLRLLRNARELAAKYAADHAIREIALTFRDARGETVAEVLEKLPTRERLLYLLHFVDGYSIRELASAFHQEEMQIRREVGAALALLDDALEDGVKTGSTEPDSADLWL